MGRTLADDIVDDVGTVFMNVEEFGEPVTFTPQCGAARMITAIVEQVMSPLQTMHGEQERCNRIRVTCRDHATLGIHEVYPADVLTWNGLKWAKAEIVERNGGAVIVSFESPKIEAYGRRGR